MSILFTISMKINWYITVLKPSVVHDISMYEKIVGVVHDRPKEKTVGKQCRVGDTNQSPEQRVEEELSTEQQKGV